MTSVLETEEHKALRAAVSALGKRYGHEYLTKVIAEKSHPTELWAEAAEWLADKALAPGTPRPVPRFA